MLPDSKFKKIFFIINEFSQVFDATIKEKSIFDGKVHHNKPCKMSESKVATILVLPICRLSLPEIFSSSVCLQPHKQQFS